MSEPIGPGDLCEYVGGKVFGPGTLRVCEEIEESAHCRECDCVTGSVRMAGEWGIWCVRAWGPVSRRSDFDAILETLKTPRDDVREPERTPQTA